MKRKKHTVCAITRGRGRFVLFTKKINKHLPLQVNKLKVWKLTSFPAEKFKFSCLAIMLYICGCIPLRTLHGSARLTAEPGERPAGPGFVVVAGERWPLGTSSKPRRPEFGTMK